MANETVLVIPDIHFPYCHKNAIDFLKEIKLKYKPDRIINLGDETDGHSYSFHKASAELYSPAHELELAIGYIETLGKIFPKMDLMESNHGSLFYRRIADAGLPKKILKDYRQLLNAPNGWKWHPRLIITLPNKTRCMFVHSLGANVLSVSQSLGMSVVQGHHHSSFEVRYWSNGESLFFGLISACLIDDTSIAYAYNKLTVKRPIVGASVILNSIPHLMPMRLNKNNEWTGEI